MPLGDYVTKFTNRLDKIVERETLTGDLNMDQSLLGEFNGAGEVQIATIAMDGLANYDRKKGFVEGDVTTGFESYKLRYDRGRSFSIDVMDDEEREMVVSANAMAEFERTKVVPEVDAIRFSTIAENAGNTVSAALTAADAALDAVIEGETAVQDMGVDLSTCLFYCSPMVKALLRKAQDYRLGQGESPNGNFATFDEMKIVTVPSARFKTKFTLNDGTTSGQTAGGFVPAADALGINFMIVHPSAAAAIQRHKKLRYFAPDVNQDKDAHKWQMRLFHDLLVYENKKGLIYAHTAPAASEASAKAKAAK